MAAGEIYRDQVLQVEPTGIEPVADAQRHGAPRDLFGLWFAANAEIATWMVGVFAVALYGTSLAGAALGFVAGNLTGYALLGALSTFGPRCGVPQMVASRLAFGRYANALPATLSFLGGVGWFAINTVFGAYALQTVTHLAYPLALGIMLLAQIVLAVYGYNLIHAFERVSALLLAAGFTLLGVVTFERANWHAAFNAHAPLAGGGEIGGIILASALGFSYATGWVPCASDYSRYLPASSKPLALWWHAFLGAAVPCVALEIMGAATVSAVHGFNFAAASPTQAMASLLGSGPLADIVLLTVVLGTLTANCMNLYSGAMAALVVKFPASSWRSPLVLGAIFGAMTAALLSAAHMASAVTFAAAIAVAVVTYAIARIRLRRWIAALLVGVLGSLLASGGGHPEQTASFYTNFLLLLSYWASPWAAVVLVDWAARMGGRVVPAGFDDGPRLRIGLFAWLAGLLVSIPFWNQAWYTGPFASAFPQCGDLSYYVGFIVAAALAAVLQRARRLDSAGQAAPA